MKNKKNIIILSLVIATVLFITILAVLYFATDILKTNQQLFYKYIGQTKIIDTNFIEQYKTANNVLEEKNNSSSMQIKVIDSKENAETHISDIQEVCTINSKGLKNVLLNQTYRDFTFSKDNQTFLTLKCLKDNNTYGIIADNILAKYLAVDNANLKELFVKLGATDVSNVPDSIPTEYEEIFKIDEEKYNEIKNNYFALINESINKDNFYKIKNENKSQTIGVSLSEAEVINIVKIILNNVKNDEALLNIINSKLQLLNYNDISTEKMQEYIQKYIDKFDNNDYSNEKDYLKISLIVKKEKIIGVEIERNYDNYNSNGWISGKAIHKRNFELDLSKNQNITLIIKEDETEILNTTTKWICDDEKVNVSFEMNGFDDLESNTIKFVYQISDFKTDNIKQNCNISINSDIEQYQISIENNITLKEDVQISKLTTENSGKLNDMTTEELSQLFTALENRIMSLYGEEITRLSANVETIEQSAKQTAEKYRAKLKEEEGLLQETEQQLENMINGVN